ncbi:hypothetical protein RFI_24789, partial [Reticulomyxa filosa]
MAARNNYVPKRTNTWDTQQNKNAVFVPKTGPRPREEGLNYGYPNGAQQNRGHWHSMSVLPSNPHSSDWTFSSDNAKRVYVSEGRQTRINGPRATYQAALPRYNERVLTQEESRTSHNNNNNYYDNYNNNYYDNYNNNYNNYHNDYDNNYDNNYKYNYNIGNNDKGNQSKETWRVRKQDRNKKARAVSNEQEKKEKDVLKMPLSLHSLSSSSSSSSQLKLGKKTLVVDIDGTLVDIDLRLQLAPGSGPGGERTTQEWSLVLNKQFFHMDRCIETALHYLRFIAKEKRWNIIYLSGFYYYYYYYYLLEKKKKRIELYNIYIYVYRYLFQKWGFPSGHIIHRPRGKKTEVFKLEMLSALSQQYAVVGYIGDRIIDDCVCAIRANVRPLLVLQNEW